MLLHPTHQKLQQENRSLRRAAEFAKFLQDVKSILSALEKPICFISYAWEDNATVTGKAANVILQERLSRLKKDLEILGAQIFLDINDMHGHMPTRMEENIAKSNIVFLIGTPRLKVRLQQTPKTNAAFEWDHIQNKVAQDKDCLLPLWFEGDFAEAFPSEVHKDLVRDMRATDAHEMMLAGLANPMGIIPNIFQLHKRYASDPIMQQYRICWERLETALRLIDLDNTPQKPEIDPQLQINFSDIQIEKTLDNKAHEALSLGKWKGQSVIVKRVQLISNDLKQTFIREAQIMGRLRHANILLLYGVSLDVGYECLVMEHCSRGSLAQVFRKGQLPTALQNKISLNVAHGLLYLHSHQNHILHQDLTSENVVLDEQYQAKLTGFCFAHAHTNSVAKAVKGSPALTWMAPEVLRGETYTAKADIYSYGVVLWEILTGKVPVIPISFDNIPDPYVTLIQSCMAEQPLRRPSAQEIVTQLESISVSYESGTKNVTLPALALHQQPDKRAELIFEQAKTAGQANNHQEAFDLYLKATTLGHVKAEANVGHYLLEGIGGTLIDKKRAYDYLLSAAKKDEPRAQYNLARMLEKGDGVTIDEIQAKYWYTQASNQTIDTKVAGQARAKLQGLFNSNVGIKNKNEG